MDQQASTQAFDCEAIGSLEARQDELLRRLDELNARIERALAACTPQHAGPLASASVVAAEPPEQIGRTSLETIPRLAHCPNGSPPAVQMARFADRAQQA